MPQLQYQKTSGTDYRKWPANAEIPRPPVALEYGSPVLAPSGDVYTWKRTPDKYSIVKWSWVDDPGSNDDCPVEKAKDNKAAGKK